MPSIFGITTFDATQKKAMGLPVAYSDTQVISFLNGYKGLFLEIGISPFLDDEVELTETLTSKNGCYDTEIKTVDCGGIGAVIAPKPCFEKYTRSICLESLEDFQCNHVTPLSYFDQECEPKAKQIQIKYKTGFTSDDDQLLMLALSTLPIVNTSTTAVLGAKKSHKSDDSETTYYQPVENQAQVFRDKQLAIISSILSKYIPEPKSKTYFA
jgi:hypothetical protein